MQLYNKTEIWVFSRKGNCNTVYTLRANLKSPWRLSTNCCKDFQGTFCAIHHLVHLYPLSLAFLYLNRLMFYSENVLTRKGPLANIWLAAHWDRKLTKTQIVQTNIQTSVGMKRYCNDILTSFFR